MKYKIATLTLLVCFLFNQDQFKLSQKDFVSNADGKEFVRGRYLIVLGDASLESSLSDVGGDFIEFKRSQGYDVDVLSYPNIASNQNELRDYLSDYYEDYPMLEYVLLVGDVTGAYAIPTHLIASYNDADYPLDQTDYPYTFFSEDEMYSPHYFIGRWSIQDQSELLALISRTIGYSRLIHPVTGADLNSDYLNNALIVAGNFADTPGVAWPVTPVWTSRWLKDRLIDFNYSTVDEFYFTASNPNEDQTSEIGSAWSDGVGIINYRGWGDASGWKKPIFKKEHIEDLSNGWELPVVFSFVCNTGDFGNENNEACFGEKMVKTGTFINPKGAVAMIGPSDLDTDTKYNNVICADVWDHILEERISELAPALHAGKQAVKREFGVDFEATGAAGTANIAEFYHHVYGVLGDPSLSVWIGKPSNMNVDINDNQELNNSFVDVVVRDDSNIFLEGVVGALIYNDELVGKGYSNSNGELTIDFDETVVPLGSDMTLYLNKDQYFQKAISVQYLSDSGSSPSQTSYVYNQEDPVFTRYGVYNSFDNDDKAPIYDWIEINQLGTNLELTDDSHANISLPFNFQYYGEDFDSLTISSNGWVSFVPTDINYFWNFSIPFPIGPSGMVAPFMDDLDDDDSENPDPLDIYYYYDSVENIFIVEWDGIHNGEDNQECAIEGYECITETFQLVLYDPAYHTTSTGDGDIKFQYKEIHDIDNGQYDGKWGNYSTIGIESPSQDHGIQYQFRNSLDNFGGYQWGSRLVEDEMAILFTTEGVSQLNIDSKIASLPSKMELISNHPNPFNPTTTIKFAINSYSNVDLIITDISGREVVRLLNNQFFSPGVYSYDFNASSLSTGIYFYTLRSDLEVVTNKMLFLK
tara:strand:+ start:940 stop:3540 length:2601 start_codon:yes stop_codon:yes gene_type:complete